MAYRCLADFLEELGHAGELARVEAEVDAALEAAEITNRVAAGGGPALLFGKVSGSDVPLLTNLLGAESRICKALGVESPAEMAGRLALLIDPAEPQRWFERLKTAPHLAALASVAPRRVKTAACQQVVRLGGDVELAELPMVRSAPQEPQGAITAGVLFAAHADTHGQVAGRWDLERLDGDRLALGWADYDEPARLLAEYRSRHEKMPLAVALGGDPAVLLAAMAPAPPAVDAFALAGLFRQKPLDVVACRSVDLRVPADADVVLEGHVDPHEPLVEAGGLCTVLGRYGPRRPMPVMHLSAITHRANPIFPAMVATAPPHELGVIVQTLGRMFLPLLKFAIAELVDVSLPAFGAARQWAAVSICKTYAGQSRRVAHAAWGQPLLAHAKVLVVVDDDVDVHDTPAVLAAIAANVHPPRDVFCEPCPADPQDIAAPPGELSGKLCLDATAKLPAEHAGPWGEKTAMSEDIRERVSERWVQYGLGPVP